MLEFEWLEVSGIDGWNTLIDKFNSGWVIEWSEKHETEKGVTFYFILNKEKPRG